MPEFLTPGARGAWASEDLLLAVPPFVPCKGVSSLLLLRGLVLLAPRLGGPSSSPEAFQRLEFAQAVQGTDPWAHAGRVLREGRTESSSFCRTTPRGRRLMRGEEGASVGEGVARLLSVCTPAQPVPGGSQAERDAPGKFLSRLVVLWANR